MTSFLPKSPLKSLERSPLVFPCMVSLSSSRSTMHKTRIFTTAVVVLISCCIHSFGADIIPKDWLSPEQLEQAENPIQQQLDTGRGMGGTAWDMAAVKDARLLLIYVKLYERLPDETSRKMLYSEQTAWLQHRQKAVASLTPEEGIKVSLDKALKQMEITDKRIAELQKRLKH